MDPSPPSPSGPALTARDRRLLADRLHWPDGVLEACEAVEAGHPGWHATWNPGGGTCQWARAGYYALPDNRRHDDPPAYGATPEQLREAIDDHPAQYRRW